MKLSDFPTGLKEEGELTIVSAYFGTDARYNDGNSMLLIINGVDEEDEESTLQFSVGEGWETKDGGKTITDTKSKKPKSGPILSSAYGKWCAAAIAACEQSKSPYLDDKNPLDATIWNDTKWRLELMETSAGWTNRKTGEKVEARSRLLPVEFLGTEDTLAPVDLPVAPVETLEAKRARLTASKPSAKPVAATNGSSPIRETLVQLAASNDDYESFYNAAIFMDEVIADDALITELLDQSPTGFYTVHHG